MKKTGFHLLIFAGVLLAGMSASFAYYYLSLFISGQFGIRRGSSGFMIIWLIYPILVAWTGVVAYKWLNQYFFKSDISTRKLFYFISWILYLFLIVFSYFRIANVFWWMPFIMVMGIILFSIIKVKKQ